MIRGHHLSFTCKHLYRQSLTFVKSRPNLWKDMCFPFPLAALACRLRRHDDVQWKVTEVRFRTIGIFSVNFSPFSDSTPILSTDLTLSPNLALLHLKLCMKL